MTKKYGSIVLIMPLILLPDLLKLSDCKKHSDRNDDDNAGTCTIGSVGDPTGRWY